ncbi:hypothetical protein KI387_016051, partial [Taxus chinensis]
MAFRRKLSFDLLRYDSSGIEHIANGDAPAAKSPGRRRRHKKKSATLASATLDNGQIYSKDQLHLAKSPLSSSSLRKCATLDIGSLAELSLIAHQESTVSEEAEMANGAILFDRNNNKHALTGSNGIMHIDRVDSGDSAGRDLICSEGADGSCLITHSIVEDVSDTCNLGFSDQSECNLGVLDRGSPAELRQRNVKISVVEENAVEVVQVEKEMSPIVLQEEQPEKKDYHESPQSLDWERLMAETSDYPSRVEMSPLGYFLGEINGGNSLRSTTSVGNDKKRQRVYNTMFHVPWRCELLIDVGFFVCLDSFLSLLTIMPARILVFFWRCWNVRQLQIPLADELSDFGCLVVLICGVALLQITAQAITLSAAIISHNNALMALLISNNFAEIKSNVFKRVSEENLHKMAYYDTVERFHIMAHIIFVLAQNILEAESQWFWSFVTNSCLIWGCEVLVDVIKHAFLAKFNEIKPAAYSEFLEALCKQTINSQSHEVHKTLTFVPLAPACVVIRILTPIYAARLPSGPVWWRWFWVAMLFSVTYLMLVSLKLMVGLGLQTHAR